MRHLLELAAPGSITIKSTGADPGIALESPLRSEITDISSLISIVMTFLFPIAAVLLFCMVIYSGFVFMTSRGNSQAVSKAQGIIISAIIGFVLLVIAFFLVRLVAFIFGFSGGILGV
jgi:hypothetical protein